MQKDAENLQAKDLKIQALILELAHLRRLRYGVKNEALSSVQRDLFEEACNEDIAALETEVEQADEQTGSAVSKPKRPRAGRQPLPPHLPCIEPNVWHEASLQAQPARDDELRVIYLQQRNQPKRPVNFFKRIIKMGQKFSFLVSQTG